MEWISILKCPITGQCLRELESSGIKLINQKIAAGEMLKADGNLMTGPLEKALSTSDGSYIYPVVNDILILLKDLALIDNRSKIRSDILSKDKQMVKNFYDTKGWISDGSGNYKDAVIYEDLREVAKEYVNKCHKRVNRFLNPSGKYMLDAASGPLQFPEYLQYSSNYTYRICVDLSFRALEEAKKKLGEKGICILCDMTNMPFQNEVMDGFISLNTIYHIPKEEQVTAIEELYRVLAPKGKGVVVYDWFNHSSWMNFWMLPFRAFAFIRNRLIDNFSRLSGRKPFQRLYFFAHSQKYLRQHLPPHKIKVWRSLSVPFMRYYIHSWLFGKQLLKWVFKMEEKNPEACGLKGEYPMLIFEKD